MAGFIDRIRQQHDAPRTRVQVIGVDPDIHACGWACVMADIHPVLPPVYGYVGLTSLRSTAESGREAVDQACAMVDLIATRWHSSRRLGEHVYVVLESQQFYPNPNDERRKMVSVANALIRVAHVTGGVQALARERSSDLSVRAFLPAAWKGQRKKEATVREAAKQLAAAGVTEVAAESFSARGEAHTTFGVSELEALPSAWEHALDGLGLALYGLRLVQEGRWELA